MAWYSTVPPDSDKAQKQKPAKKNRYQRYKSLIEIKFPDVNGYEYLVNHLMEVGPVQYGAMGCAMAVSWQELDAYNNCLDLQLTPWELSMIRNMSRTYAAEFSHSNDRVTNPPTERPTE